MKLFTVGPVEMYPETLKIEGTQLPYFRDDAFSEIMKRCGDLFLRSVNAPADALFIPLTCSGTGGMDAAVQNVLTKRDRVLVINGGSFGQRFYDICIRYDIPADSYEIPFGESFSFERLEEYSGKGYSALLVNACETSTGQGFDLKRLGGFCKRNGMLFIIDAVSAYLADHIDMKEQNADVIITSSHKALALSPGAAVIALSERAGRRACENKASYYFDFKDYIENMKRGQTPFTPAVGIFIALAARLEGIMLSGIKKSLLPDSEEYRNISEETVKKAMENSVMLHEDRALYFREALKELPVVIPEYPLSNCCTPVLFPDGNADHIYTDLREKSGLVLTPSGGKLKSKMLRVGHLGNLNKDDHDHLIDRLKDIMK